MFFNQSFLSFPVLHDGQPYDRPSSHIYMLDLEGFTKVKVERLEPMVDEIVDFCNENELDLDQPVLEETKPSQVQGFIFSKVHFSTFRLKIELTYTKIVFSSFY